MDRASGGVLRSTEFDGSKPLDELFARRVRLGILVARRSIVSPTLANVGFVAKQFDVHHPNGVRTAPELEGT